MRRRITVALGVTAVTVALAVGADVAVLAHRPAHVDIAMPSTSSSAAGETWLILGTDSRATVPGDQNRYGTTQEVEGSRADVIALVRPSEAGLTVINLPRDLTINSKGMELDRLATTYVPGPQNTVNALCTGLGIPTTHLLTIDMAQFADIIDSLGGIEVDVPEPVRDAYTGLNLTSAGHHRLTGVDALALVRSRHPEILRDGAWVAMNEADGAQRRSESTATVMRAVLSAVGQKASNPLSLHQLAHTVAGNITLDSGTGLGDLASLGRSATKAKRPIPPHSSTFRRGLVTIPSSSHPTRRLAICWRSMAILPRPATRQIPEVLVAETTRVPQHLSVFRASPPIAVFVT